MSEKQDDAQDRYLYALGNHKDKSVFAIPKKTWNGEYVPNGLECTATTYFKDTPSDFKELCANATVVGVELSNKENNPTPLNIVRIDSKDAPDIFNRDRYELYDIPSTSTTYQSVIGKYGIEESKELKQFINDNYFLVGPYRNFPGHHASTVSATLLKISDVKFPED